MPKLQCTGKPQQHSHFPFLLHSTPHRILDCNSRLRNQPLPNAQLPRRIDIASRLNKSRGQRIIWLLEELKVDYEIKVYKRDKHFRAPGELKDVHPLGKSPTITIETPGQEKPLVLAESGPIVEYLCDYFGPQFIPRRYPEGKDGVIGAETEQWLRHRVSPILFLHDLQ